MREIETGEMLREVERDRIGQILREIERDKDRRDIERG